MGHLNDEERENLVAYLDGELDAGTARTLEAKLNLDPKARAEAEALKQAWSMLDYLPRTDPSPTFTTRTLERLALQTGQMRHAGPRRWLFGVGWVAAVVTAAGLGFAAARLAWHAPPAQPRDPPDLEEQMVRHLRAIENVHLYNQVDDLDFLRALDQPDLFGKEPGS
jgi:anti-sigma factor RsiW